jgi:hypothetical protein
LSRVVLFRVTPTTTVSAGGDTAGGESGGGGGGDASYIVEHSGVLQLLNVQRPLQPGYHALHPNAVATLAAIMRHFDTAGRQTRVRGGSSGGEGAAPFAVATYAINASALPDELLHLVMNHADWRTWAALARASASCARYALPRIRLDVHGKVLVVKSVRPALWIGEMVRLVGYEVLERAGGGSTSGSVGAPDSAGGDEGKAETGEGQAWFLVRPVKNSYKLGFPPGASMAAHFRLVIGEGERRSFLTDVVCKLLRVRKGELFARQESMDDEGFIDEDE